MRLCDPSELTEEFKSYCKNIKCTVIILKTTKHINTCVLVTVRIFVRKKKYLIIKCFCDNNDL